MTTHGYARQSALAPAQTLGRAERYQGNLASLNVNNDTQQVTSTPPVPHHHALTNRTLRPSASAWTHRTTLRQSAMSVMPRRPLWLFVALALSTIIATFLLFPRKGDVTSLGLRVPPWQHSISGSKPEDTSGPDLDVIKELKIYADGRDAGQPFEYRRYCFDAQLRNGTERSSLVEVPQKILETEAYLLTSEYALPPCQVTVGMDVPFFDPRAKVDTSELFLGMATLLKRFDAALPAMSRWLSNTGTRLLVLLVDQPDLETNAEQVASARAKAADLGIEVVFEPYTGGQEDSEGLKNFALAELLHKNRTPNTTWFGIIDDDTFFVSLDSMVKALKPYDPTQDWYIGQLSEGLFRIAQEGFKAWGGAGFFVSPPLMESLARNSPHCKSLDAGFGDLLWRDCILEITSPTIPLTELPGLHQIDLWGDVSGWYETGWNPLLTVHHWRSWHYHDVPFAHIVSDVAGPETFLQRYNFADDVVMTNGYSIVSYPNGLPDLNLTELTFVERVGSEEKPGRLEFHHSLGATRPALELGKDKISWKFAYSTRGEDGSVRQFYVKHGVPSVPENRDSVIEIDWQR